jgi:hypothetical protein
VELPRYYKRASGTALPEASGLYLLIRAWEFAATVRGSEVDPLTQRLYADLAFVPAIVTDASNVAVRSQWTIKHTPHNGRSDESRDASSTSRVIKGLSKGIPK